MKPALSVIAFTVLSGAGLGALALLAVADLVGTLAGRAWLPLQVLERTSIVSLALVVLGLCSSTLHLGNPRNAWRSLSRVRTSWLSREAAAAIALLVSASAWIATMLSSGPAALRIVLTVTVVALSWLTLYCTAMIYASLKPIRQWYTPRVPLAYFVLGHASGAILVVAAARIHGEAAVGFAMAAGVLLAIAAAVKVDYYGFIASDAGRLTIEQAIGVPNGVHPPGASPTRMQARLLDAGHSRGTFLTREFGYSPSPRERSTLRVVFWVAGFVVPAIWLVAGGGVAGAALALVAITVGLFAERWLFFAEARHTVRLYHGERST